MDELIESYLATELLLIFVGEEYDNTVDNEYVKVNFYDQTFYENKKRMLGDEIFGIYSELGFLFKKLKENGIQISY